MDSLEGFIKSKCSDLKLAAECGVYVASINFNDNTTVFMIDSGDDDLLVVVGETHGFIGNFEMHGDTMVLKAPLSAENAIILRKLFDFTAPKAVLRDKRSVGVGDRLGIATDGHIRAFNRFDVSPVFCQQSMRELTLTSRTYENVLDCVTFSVFRNGFKRGFGADGDHLKTLKEVEYAINCGFTMITLDCSEYIDNSIEPMSAEELQVLTPLDIAYENTYLNKSFEVEGHALTFNDETLKRAALTYSKAIEFASEVYATKIITAPHQVDFEISIDETTTPTSPLQHFFVANELAKKGITPTSMAPRFCGEFQKGVDYRGDIIQFEQELALHAAIARFFNYKISVHSGSDKFKVFEMVSKYTNGNFHLKTAGTSWLEAMRLVAISDPTLFREIWEFSIASFDDACRFYHVSATLDEIPSITSMADGLLKNLFEDDNSRQLIHITYGHILNAKNIDGTDRFKTTLFSLWRKQRELYAQLLNNHIGKHLELLCKQC